MNKLRRFNPVGKRLPSLLSTFVFTDDFLKKWKPLIQSLSRQYQIPRRLPSDDIEQELATQLWDLALRVDPNLYPADFARLAKAELRNKCVDLTRWHNAQRRIGSVGGGIACHGCGTVTRMDRNGDTPVCPKCGCVGHPEDNTEFISWIAIKVPDSSFGMTEVADHGVVPTGVIAHESAQNVPEEADYNNIISLIQGRLPNELSLTLFSMFMEPPEFVTTFIVDSGYRPIPIKAPPEILASILHFGYGISATTAEIRASVKAVKMVVDELLRESSVD